MKYIVIDFEYNQPFDFTRNEKGRVVKECPFEIIQIGAVKLNEKFEVLDTVNIYIKPTLYKRIHPFVEKITKINKKTLENEKYFPEIFDTFIEFIEKDSVFCFWGANDFKELLRNVIYYKLDYKLLPNKFINVQSLTSNFLKYPAGKAIGLRNAIEMLGLPTTLDFHNALNDAIYTSEIFKILKNTKLIQEKMSLKLLTKETADKNYRINTYLLYKEIEKYFGRELTKKEKAVIKKVYELGRQGTFDAKKIE